MKRAAIAGSLSFAAIAAWTAGGRAQTMCAIPPPIRAVQAAQKSAGVSHPPVVLTPRYSPGDSMRYQVSLRSQSRSLLGGALENRQGAAEIGLSVGLMLRLDVLAPIPVTAAAAPSQRPADRPPLRLRATYELVSTELLGDTYDPAATKLLEPYRNLEGRAIEFQLGSNGKVEYMSGLDQVVQDAKLLETARSWLEQLGAGLGAPLAGVVPGQSWERTQEVEESPLKGTQLHSSSTYLRDEPCDIEKPEQDQCAVVLMRYSLGQKPGEKNPTPETFKKKKLRTSGQWLSQGESLVYVSLRSGRTVSVTQSSEELIDVSIRREDGGMPFRYSGQSKSETHLLLLDETSGTQ